MSEAKTTAGDAVVQLGFKDGDYIQEFGYDEDVDLDLRDGIEEVIGSDLLDEDDLLLVGTDLAGDYFLSGPGKLKAFNL